ncbi:MAG: GNAT family N-acetyltransferase [Bacteroidetes bacterium]|nr:GNAT family N-acetyltransferase [Bacteroidota bacterium]
MLLQFRTGTNSDIPQLQELAIKSWGEYEKVLLPDDWIKLFSNISNPDTYSELLEIAHCEVCTNEENTIVGMAFLVPSGNATEIYEASWCQLRFVSVDPSYNGQGIAKTLTQKCISLAKQQNEQIMALHTSEMMDKARHIYESLGFTILKEIPPRFNKKYWLYTLTI